MYGPRQATRWNARTLQREPVEEPERYRHGPFGPYRMDPRYQGRREQEMMGYHVPHLATANPQHSPYYMGAYNDPNAPPNVPPDEPYEMPPGYPPPPAVPHQDPHGTYGKTYPPYGVPV